MTSADDLILVLDAGTTSTRAMVFARDGALRASAQRSLTQHYPRDGWVEHDPEEIWQASLAVLREAAGQVGVAQIRCLGITNQRETVVAWDRTTGVALARALVWQDRRTADACAALRKAGHEAEVQRRTGLLLDPYFSATKMRWLLDHVPGVAAASAAGRLALGTVESWLVHRLTGGMHITDASNASRTSLLPLAGAGWDAGLASLFGVPLAALGEVVDCAGELGEVLPEWLGRGIAITGLAGDQQAATIGQGCLAPGDTKATYGTGAFVLANLGARLPVSGHRLLGGVGIGPALSGLGAPHWRPEARGSITGLSFATTRAHIARAALEAMACQTHDLADAYAADGAKWTSLKIDGGMSANDWMAQDLADVLDVPVERPDFVETTALGAGMLAGLGAGLFASLAEASAMRGGLRRFTPGMAAGERARRLAAWQRALARV